MTVDRGERENSRVKDLVDILLLIETGLDKERVSLSLKNTFRRRGEVPVPHHPPNAPDSWRQPFKQMAAECGLDTDFDKALESVSAYWSKLGK